MKARYVKKSICPCGFPALGEHVPLGKEYRVYPLTLRPAIWKCGGCGQEQAIVTINADQPDPARPPGPLPVGILKFQWRSNGNA